MKKVFACILSVLIFTVLATACDQNASDPSDSTAPETTQAATEQTTEEELTVPVQTEQTTEEQTTVQEESTLNELGLPFEIIEVPVGHVNGQTMYGYNASGLFIFDRQYGYMYSDEDNNMLVVTNDTMTAGTLSATFCSAYGNINDNGIIFGLEEIPTENEDYYFWEFGPAYYFLFISDAQHLYLAKAGFNGNPWTELKVTEQPVTNYTHGDTEITITVEFDGEGTILCYANDQLLIEYFDDQPIKGSYYGIRCEVFGVEYYDIQAIHE